MELIQEQGQSHRVTGNAIDPLCWFWFPESPAEILRTNTCADDSSPT